MRVWIEIDSGERESLMIKRPVTKRRGSGDKERESGERERVLRVRSGERGRAVRFERVIRESGVRERVVKEREGGERDRNDGRGRAESSVREWHERKSGERERVVKEGESVLRERVVRKREWREMDRYSSNAALTSSILCEIDERECGERE